MFITILLSVSASYSYINFNCWFYILFLLYLFIYIFIYFLVLLFFFIWRKKVCRVTQAQKISWFLSSVFVTLLFPPAVSLHLGTDTEIRIKPHTFGASHKIHRRMFIYLPSFVFVTFLISASASYSCLHFEYWHFQAWERPGNFGVLLGIKGCFFLLFLPFFPLFQYCSHFLFSFLSVRIGRSLCVML